MKMTAFQAWERTLVISKIIREARPMPQKGKYLLARMHAKMLPEFNAVNDQRDKMIGAYDYHEVTDGVASQAFSVPTDKMAEFNAAWKPIADAEIEVDVQPIPLSALDLGSMSNGSIEANELLTLGELISE